MKEQWQRSARSHRLIWIIPPIDIIKEWPQASYLICLTRFYNKHCIHLPILVACSDTNGFTLCYHPLLILNHSFYLSPVWRGILQPTTGSSVPLQWMLIQGRTPPLLSRWGHLLCCWLDYPSPIDGWREKRRWLVVMARLQCCLTVEFSRCSARLLLLEVQVSAAYRSTTFLLIVFPHD